MRAATKQKKAVAKAADYLKQFGISEDAIRAAAEKAVEKTPEEISWEAEAVLSFIEKPERFMTRKCKRCGDVFGTNYKYNAYCGNSCRGLALKELGFEWDPFADPKQRWGGEPPLTIPAEAIHKILAAAERAKEGLGLMSESQNQTDTATAYAAAGTPGQASAAEESVLKSEHLHQRTSEARTSLDFSLPELDES